MFRFVVLLFASALYLTPLAAVAQTGLTYDDQVFDFGHVGIDFTVFHDYRYINRFDVPVKIKDVVVSCDCSSVMPSDTIVMPGDTIYFTLNFNTKDYYGPTNKSFKVFTDNPSAPELEYFNLSTVGQWFQGLKPDNISLFFIPGKGPSEVSIPNKKFDKITLGRMMPHDNSFVVDVLEGSADQGKSLKFMVTPADNFAKGTHLTSLTFEVNKSGEDKPSIFSIPVKIVRY